MSEVTCSTCGIVLDSSQADVTGRGYRCSRCTLKSTIDAARGINDVGDHLSSDERVTRAKSAVTEIWRGACVAVGGIFVAGIVPFPFHDIVGAVIFFAGIGAISHGVLTRREMRGNATT